MRCARYGAETRFINFTPKPSIINSAKTRVTIPTMQRAKVAETLKWGRPTSANLPHPAGRAKRRKRVKLSLATLEPRARADWPAFAHGSVRCGRAGMRLLVVARLDMD